MQDVSENGRTMEPAENGPANGSSQPETDLPTEYWAPSGVVSAMWISLSIAFGALAFFLSGFVYSLVGERAASETFDLNWPAIGGLTLLALGLHQVIHLGLSRLFGGSPRIDLDVIQMVFPVMYCRTNGQHFSRNQFLIYALAPLLVLSLVGFGLMPLDERATWLIIPMTANAVISMRDVWMAWVVWKLPSGSLVRSERDGLLLIRAN
jgi:hypothetical protein